eukprot:403334195
MTIDFNRGNLKELEEDPYGIKNIKINKPKQKEIAKAQQRHDKKDEDEQGSKSEFQYNEVLESISQQNKKPKTINEQPASQIQLSKEQRQTLQSLYLMKYNRALLSSDELTRFELYNYANKFLSGAFTIIVPIAFYSHLNIKFDVPDYYKVARRVFFGIGLFGMATLVIGRAQSIYHGSLKEKYLEKYSDEQLRNFDEFVQDQQLSSSSHDSKELNQSKRVNRQKDGRNQKCTELYYEDQGIQIEKY